MMVVVVVGVWSSLSLGDFIIILVAGSLSRLGGCCDAILVSSLVSCHPGLPWEVTTDRHSRFKVHRMRLPDDD